MKKVVAVIMLCSIGASVLGQSRAYSDEPLKPVENRRVDMGSFEEPPGLKMRNNGRVLTILGGALFMGGAIVLSSADELYYSASTNGGSEGDPKAAVGILMMTGGAGMAIPGIIMWSKGSKKYKAYQAEQSASIGIKGAGLSLRFRF